jgi:hypothetical protein
MIRALIIAGFVALAATAQAKPVWEDSSRSWEDRLGAAAEERANHSVTYDGSGRTIPYPMGDVPPNIGVCTDEVVRIYRKVGIDFQQLVHEDMMRAFFEYPQKFGEKRPNTNFDHRRVGNMQRFLERNATVLPITDNGDDYKPGDIVVWDLDNSQLHIGVVTRKRSKDGKRPLVLHNIAHGPRINDQLFYFPILGHYRFDGTVKHTGPFLANTAFARPREKPEPPPEPADVPAAN